MRDVSTKEPVFKFFVEYDDRVVEAPPRRPIDTVETERKFGKGFTDLFARTEVNLYVTWLSLHRHEDANEHPPDFDKWLPTVARFWMEGKNLPDADEAPKVVGNE